MKRFEKNLSFGKAHGTQRKYFHRRKEHTIVQNQYTARRDLEQNLPGLF